MYGLEFTFLKMLQESPYVTKNPEEADYFYYIAYFYYGWCELLSHPRGG